MTAILEDSEGLIDLAMENMVVFAILGLILTAVGVYGWFYVPSFKLMVMKLIKKHDAEIMELFEKHLTPKMKDALDDVASKHVKDEILKNVIMETFDHTEKKAQGTVKKIIRDAAKEAK